LSEFLSAPQSAFYRLPNIISIPLVFFKSIHLIRIPGAAFPIVHPVGCSAGRPSYICTLVHGATFIADCSLTLGLSPPRLIVMPHGVEVHLFTDPVLVHGHVNLNSSLRQIKP
jgi:hypothetical protein